MSKASILKELKKSLPHIKNIQDWGSFEREIFYVFRKDEARRDKVRKELFQPGDKVIFLNNDSWPCKGTVQKILLKKIQVKCDEEDWSMRVNPSRMGLRKSEGATV